MLNDFKREDASQCNQDQESKPTASPLDRRSFVVGAAAAGAVLALPRWADAAESVFSPNGTSNFGLTPFDDDLSAIRAEIAKRHDETVKRLQTWIKQPSIAAENRGMNEGCELTMQMLREAGFQQVTKDAHRRPAGHLCHARCRRSENTGSLLHV